MDLCMNYLFRNISLLLITSCNVCFSSDYDEFDKSKMLILAASKGNQEVVNFCLENGAKVNSVSDFNLEGPFMVCTNVTIQLPFRLDKNPAVSLGIVC